MVSFHRSAQVATEEQPEAPAVDLVAPVEQRSAAAFPRVNLMPEIVVAEARAHRAKMLLVVGTVASLVVVGGLYYLAAGTVGESQDRLDAAQATSAQLATDKAKYSDVPKVQSQVSAVVAQQYLALGGEVRWSFLLNDLAITLPAGTSLTNLSGTVNETPPGTATAGSSTGSGQTTSVNGNPGIGTITYQGEAAGYAQVANFLDSQAKQKTLVDPYLSSVTAPTQTTASSKGLTFASTATVTAAALSHRYDVKAGG
jgi:Tfp pilus assembly protein PilN